MDDYMHLLTEAIQANLSNTGRCLTGSFTEDNTRNFTGLLLEDVRVNSYLTGNMDGEINPLVELLYGEDTSQFQLNKLQDHLARIEMQVQQLERRIPYRIEQRLLVAPAETASYDGDTEFEDEGPPRNKNKQPAGNKAQPSNKANKDGKPNEGKKGQSDNHENGGNCFTRLFFGNCWSGSQCTKNKGKKGACPAYGTCPCKDDAPCAKIVKKPCPANQKKNKGNGGKGKSGGQSGGSKGKSDNKKKDENPLSAICGKICPPCVRSKHKGEDGEGSKPGWRCGTCLKKKHVHTPCCCRCKDNPPLPKEEPKKKDNSQAKPQSTQPGGKEQPPKGKAPPKRALTSDEYETGDEFEDARSVHSAIVIPKSEDKDPTLEPMRCVGCTDCDDIRRSTGEQKKETTEVLKSVHNNNQDTVKNEFTINQEGEIEIFPRSSTNFQVLLPPSISRETTDNNLVSHQILKTLSTIHGPIRVEQKIVVKGTKNAFVIVTHGEACECNICSTLKNDSITQKTQNSSPKVVRFPTDNGFDTLISHSDNCQCNLCSVLEQGITEEVSKKKLGKSQSHIVWASWSKNNLRTSNDRSSASVTQGSHPEMYKTATHELKGNSDTFKKHFHKNKEEKKNRKKKCHCTKCVKRRKVKRLKKRLEHAIGASDISHALRDLSHHGFTVQPDLEDNVSQNEGDEEEDKSRKSWTTSGRRVSFSGDTKTQLKSDSDLIAIPGSLQFTDERNDLIVSTRRDDDAQKMKHKGIKLASPESLQHGEEKTFSYSTRPHSKNTKRSAKHCDCKFCNNEYQETDTRETTESDIVQHQPSIDEHQTCFPESSRATTKSSSRRDTSTSQSERQHEKMVDEVTHPDDDLVRPPTRCEPGCSGRCRFLTPRDELSRLGSAHITPVTLLQQASRDRLPPMILHWLPSNPGVSTAFSSDSYYIPDIDEFPTSDRETTKPPYQSQTNARPEPGSSGGNRRNHAR